ncbi:MAG TPA: cytochrome c nitrite reductase small subunit [Planctomycetes bacterium]|nr:cytochrome c nitrite reductase small subunit [Planctomycetota bacterium]
MPRRIIALAFVPAAWRLPIWLALGVFAGLAVLTIHVSRAPSYLSDAPETCMNCHVMTQAYVTWNHSSHRNVATCNDCHVPHTNVVEKYAFKAKDGMRHASMFTLRMEPQVIQLSSAAVPVVEQNCRRCHQQLVGDVHLREWQPGDNRCWDCHREVPHGRVSSLSTAFDVSAPQLPGVLDNPHQMQTGGRDPRPAKEPTHE